MSLFLDVIVGTPPVAAEPVRQSFPWLPVVLLAAVLVAVVVIAVVSRRRK